MWLKTLKRALMPALSFVTLASIGLAIGCGDEEQSRHVEKGLCRNARENPVEYVRVLCEYRDAAVAHRPFDVYGYGQTMPAPHQAAINAFCLVVNEPPKNFAARTKADPAYFDDLIVTTARAEGEFGSAGALRQAVNRLGSILAAESAGRDQVGHFARACY
jgi:hypothetical protein